MNEIFLGCGGEVNAEGLEVVVKLWLRALPVSVVGTFHFSDRYVRLGEGVVLGGLEEAVLKLWLRVLLASVVRGMRCPSSCMVIGIVGALITFFG